MGAVAAGPVVGSVVLLLGPPSTAFLLNAATFALSALAVLSIPAGPVFAPAARGPSGRASSPTSSRVPARCARNPVAVRLVGADVVCSVVYGMQTVLLLLLSRHLGFGDAGYGYVLAGLGVGGILGTTLAGRAARSARPRAVLVGALLLLAVPSSLMAVTPWLPGAAGAGR